MSNPTDLQNDQALCLSYDDAEAQNILFQDSLFEVGQTETTSNIEEHKVKLMYMEKKSVRLKWHGVALSEYWRKKQIPRGLRINKTPTLGSHDPEFVRKWEKILNKCSLDLTLLIIEQTKKDAEKVQTEISELKSTLKENNASQLSKLETEIKAGLDTFEEELKAFKIKKFERDAEDYRRGLVYNWTRRDTRIPRGTARLQRHGRQLQHRPIRDLLLTSEAETSDQGHTSASSTDEAFLGGGARGRRGRRRRGGGNESRDPNRVTRSLHRNIR